MLASGQKWQEGIAVALTENSTFTEACSTRLVPASTLGHDATAPDGRRVNTKLTQGQSVALHRPRAGPVRVVYNGPGGVVWDACGKPQKNGQRPISLTRLRALDAALMDTARLPLFREPPV